MRHVLLAAARRRCAFEGDNPFGRQPGRAACPCHSKPEPSLFFGSRTASSRIIVALAVQYVCALFAERKRELWGDISRAKCLWYNNTERALTQCVYTHNVRARARVPSMVRERAKRRQRRRRRLAAFIKSLPNGNYAPRSSQYVAPNEAYNTRRIDDIRMNCMCVCVLSSSLSSPSSSTGEGGTATTISRMENWISCSAHNHTCQNTGQFFFVLSYSTEHLHVPRFLMWMRLNTRKS